jgi:predicted GNAT family acetyltransferase
MAGERMRQDGYAEISGVCVHPDAQGEGLGKALSRFVAGKICSRGEQPYLHSYETNGRAIALYQSIGFALRQRMNVAAVQRVE